MPRTVEAIDVANDGDEVVLPASEKRRTRFKRTTGSKKW